MKKFLVGILAIGFIFAFAACDPDFSPNSSGKTIGIEQSELKNSEDINKIEQPHVGQSVALWTGATRNSIFLDDLVSISSCNELEAFIGTYPQEPEVASALRAVASGFDFNTKKIVLFSFIHSSSVEEIALVRVNDENGLVILSFECASLGGGYAEDEKETLFVFDIALDSKATQCKAEVQDVSGNDAAGCYLYMNTNLKNIRGYEEWKSLKAERKS